MKAHSSNPRPFLKPPNRQLYLLAWQHFALRLKLLLRLTFLKRPGQLLIVWSRPTKTFLSRHKTQLKFRLSLPQPKKSRQPALKALLPLPYLLKMQQKLPALFIPLPPRSSRLLNAQARLIRLALKCKKHLRQQRKNRCKRLPALWKSSQVLSRRLPGKKQALSHRAALRCVFTVAPLVGALPLASRQ